ncbi:MAG: hypothetical protein GX670_09300 [Bacteroidales bacterium]|nr:hypothetical protein [Bacteroidales bacterium]
MEIGSIFDIEVDALFKVGENKFNLPFMEGKHYNYTSFFNTGRSAIEYLLGKVIASRYGNKIFVPYFICSSVTDAIMRAGYRAEFYSITDNFQIDIESLEKKYSRDVRAVYVVHYFGGYLDQKSYEYLMQLQSRGVVIIEDITLSIYTKHSHLIGFGNYVLGSLRKWLPIPDGAFLTSVNRIPEIDILEGYNEYSFCYFVAQIMKGAYLNNSSLDKNEYLEISKKAMKALFSDYTIRKMTVISERYLSAYDPEKVIKARIDNYDYLIKNTEEISFIRPVLSRLDGQVPFGFVVLCDQRDKLFQYLIANDIYCNIHWRIPGTFCDKISRKLSESILTIPCDQRYGKKEMDYIIGVLNAFN